MRMLNRRMQLLLDEERYTKVASEAKRRGVSAAEVIRDAIDQLQTLAERQQREAILAEIFAADPMPVPDDPAEIRREIDEAHDRFVE